MKFNKIVTASILAVVLSTTAFADNIAKKELAEPIIKLMPHLMEIRDTLALNAEQATTIDNWLASAPKKRKALEQEVLTIRAELREALLTRNTRIKRDALEEKLAAATTRLVEMSSLCARMLHKTLTEAQYAKVIEHYKNKQ